MEKEMENIIKANKRQKIYMVILSIILIICISLGGYYIYDEKTNNNQNHEEINASTDEKNSSNEKKAVNITNSDLAKQLHKQLITDDGTYGLYANEKISITDTTNKYFLNFNFRNYMNKLNVKFEKGVTWDNTGEYMTKITKEDFKSYIKERFNSSLDYNLSVGEILKLDGMKEIKSFDNYYGFIFAARGGGVELAKNKLIKAEQLGDYIYLYDTFAFCGSYEGDELCSAVANENGVMLNKIYSCVSMLPDNPGDDYKNVSLCEVDFENLPDYVLNNMQDKLNTFKHTFKKANDNNYYWVSSEINK